jgi:hypothetical protein
MDRDEAIKAATSIDGWLTEREAGALYDLAKEATGPIVEIGSWQGRSTAALALGSMAGAGHPVYAIDSFEGVPPADRPSASGLQPGWKSSTPELVRANLDRVGVNGLVKIIPKASQDAVDEIPGCAVLFVDGGHDYLTVSRDFRLYFPKLALGGMLMVHDCHESDLDVVRAFDEQIMRDPSRWRVHRRVDSAMIAERCVVERRKVMLAAPGKGFSWGAVSGISQSSLGAHEVTARNNSNGWDDFNALWAQALNAYEGGEITHFAMLHSDVEPSPGWLDVLIGELERLDAHMVSTAIPLKDIRGLTSCGLGDKDNPWGAFRRFTMWEIMELPETFGIEDTPHPDKVLLHNTGCWVCDLRKPLFFETDERGRLKCFFDFPTGVTRGPDHQWMNLRESEDWYFSRQLHALGARTFITRKIPLSHRGDAQFPNWRGWGTYMNGDDDTRAKWDKNAPAETTPERND